MSKLTVLQVLPALDSGGVERGTVEIVQALHQRGHRALVTSSGGRMVSEVVTAGGEHITLPLKTKNPFKIALNAFKLKALIRRRNVDVVHARSRAPAWSAWLACKLARVPFVTTFHADYKTDFPGKCCYNGVMARGARVIAISQFIVDKIRTTYAVPEEKIVLIHRGADMALFDQHAVTVDRVTTLRSQWALPDNVPIILCPGRLSRTKGQDVLLEALSQLTYLPWHVVFVGSDQGRSSVSADLQQMSGELGLTERVSFVGDCRDMPAAYALATVVVAPSLLPEAFGRVLVEAQAMERLIISSNLGAAPESILPGETGWLVTADDPAALAAALQEFFSLSTNERRSREIKASKHVRARFDTALMCQKTLDVYESVRVSK